MNASLVSPPTFCSTPKPKMPKMSVAARLLMLRRMRETEAAGQGKVRESPITAAEVEDEVDDDVGKEEVAAATHSAQEDTKSSSRRSENVGVGLEALQASEAPEIPVQSPPEAPPPRSRSAFHVPGESPSWDVMQKVSRQIEYYFGDYNLPRDRFMLELMLEDDGKFCSKRFCVSSLLNFT